MAEGKAARMPVWQSLGEDETFPLPHWIGVSGTSSDGLNNKTQEFIHRIRDVSPETAVAWEKEVKDTVVQIDEDGVRRMLRVLRRRCLVLNKSMMVGDLFDEVSSVFSIVFFKQASALSTLRNGQSRSNI